VLTDDELVGEPVAAAAVEDPWNFWVFSVRGDARLNGESREQEQEFELSLNADRVTEQWIIDLSTEGSHREQEFKLTDRTIRSVRRDYEARAAVARSIARLWSAGVSTEVGTSSFSNQDLYARMAGLLEYSFFPYTEFSRRRATLQYSVGVRHFDYEELTIFDRFSEQR